MKGFFYFIGCSNVIIVVGIRSYAHPPPADDTAVIPMDIGNGKSLSAEGGYIVANLTKALQQ